MDDSVGRLLIFPHDRPAVDRQHLSWSTKSSRNFKSDSMVRYNKTHSAGIFVDAQPVAVVKSRDRLVGLESVGRDFAVRDVVAQDRVLDVAAERVDTGAQLPRDAGESFVGRSEQRERLFFSNDSNFFSQINLYTILIPLRESILSADRILRHSERNRWRPALAPSPICFSTVSLEKV